MFRKFRSRLTYANVTATLALFLALGGGAAYAANEWNSANIQDNTLQSRDLKDNAGVKSADVVDDTASGGGLVGSDIRPDALTSNDVRGLTGADVTNNSLTGFDIDEGTLNVGARAQSSGHRSIAKGAGGVQTTLLSFGEITLKGQCNDNGAQGSSALIFLDTPAEGTNHVRPGSPLYDVSPTNAPNTGAGGEFSVTRTNGNGGGHSLQGVAHVVVNAGGRCLFSASGTGG